MAKQPYRIPFDGKEMLEYTTAADGVVKTATHQVYWPTKWRDNTEFSARIQITGQYRGRSAARVRCKNVDNGETYSMGLSSFYNAVVAFGALSGGLITGIWTFRKQGANYSLAPVCEESNA
jgi:hypothetical protein